jgi:hypothetical protein
MQVQVAGRVSLKVVWHQLLQAENGSRWTLKNASHPPFLDSLTTIYPDAPLVLTHRDPVEVVGSACGLIRHLRPMFSDIGDLREIADQMIGTFDHMIARLNCACRSTFRAMGIRRSSGTRRA